jgi:hypothetical protein
MAVDWTGNDGCWIWSEVTRDYRMGSSFYYLIGYIKKPDSAKNSLNIEEYIRNLDEYPDSDPDFLPGINQW